MVQLPNGRPCHTGPVDFGRLLGPFLLLTASNADSVIRIWSVDELKALESEDSAFYSLQPLKEIALAAKESISAIETEFFEQSLLLVKTKNGVLLELSRLFRASLI